MTVDATKVAEVYTITRQDAGEVYPITFPYIHKEYVKCYVANETTKEQTDLVLGVDYTISDETHELTVVAGQEIGNKVVIYRVTELTQEIDWEDGQAVYTPDIEQADDKLTHIVQELAEQVDRSVKITKQEAAAGTNPEYRWEEIEAAREQVLAAQAATEQAKVDAEFAKDEAESARDETLDARDTALEIIDTAKTEAQEAIATDKQGALDAIEAGKVDAIAGINSAAQSAQQDIANDTQDAKDSIAASTATAQQTILEDSATALNAINTATHAGVESIENAASGYGEAITQAKDDAIAAVGTSGAEWVEKAKEEADRSSTEADRAKTEADRAESIVKVGPATTEKLGLVKVGSGLSVDVNGLLTANIATTDNPGIVKPGKNLTVEANGTLNATADPYVLPVASAETLGGVKVGDGLEIDADGKLKAKAQPVDVATREQAGIVKPGVEMSIEDDGTLNDKRDVLYMQERPASVPANLKNGGLVLFGDAKMPGGGSSTLPELTGEHVVGYFNGKPVYESAPFVYSNGGITSGGVTVATIPSEVEMVFGVSAFYRSKGAPLKCCPLPVYSSSGWNANAYVNENGKIIIAATGYTTTSYEYHITIRYTKTTD